MKLPWRDTRESPSPSKETPPSGGQSCPTLARAIENIARRERPTVLDLGPMCGDTVVYFADRGARVTVQDPDIAPTGADAEVEGETTPAFRLDQPDGAYDLVIAWEWCDFVGPESLDAFCAELNRVLKDDGWLLLFSLNQPPPDDGRGDRPCRYRVLADDKLAREAHEGALRRRWQYPTRRIEAALEPLSVQSLHLQRNQIREFLAHKPRAKVNRAQEKTS